MRADLRRLVQDAWLVTIGLALALGWALTDLVRGIGSFVDHLMLHVPTGNGLNSAYTQIYAPGGNALTWVVHGHVVTVDGIVVGLIEVAAALMVAILVARYRSSTPAEVPKSV